MASKAAQKRLTKEYLAMQKESPPFVWAAPDEKNILTLESGLERGYHRSHAWNMTQKRYEEAFPDYCQLRMVDLPNMGENGRDKPDPEEMAIFSFTAVPPPAPSSTSNVPPTHNTPLFKLNPSTNLTTPSHATASSDSVARPVSAGNGLAKTDKSDGESNHANFAATWGRVIWEKWRWGVLIVLAVVVSRFSASA
ncbi:hypothetical protein ONZ45_g5870 [Pleurotus djamor]|nr:hypothetical protein ONZ45_g5870 [Pleurotus djamor]